MRTKMIDLTKKQHISLVKRFQPTMSREQWQNIKLQLGLNKR